MRVCRVPVRAYAYALTRVRMCISVDLCVRVREVCVLVRDFKEAIFINLSHPDII